MLDFTERMFIHLVYRQRVSELSGKAFKGFFQEIMARRYPGFLDIRTHGNIGDMGADGLWLDQPPRLSGRA